MMKSKNSFFKISGVLIKDLPTIIGDDGLEVVLNRRKQDAFIKDFVKALSKDMKKRDFRTMLQRESNGESAAYHFDIAVEIENGTENFLHDCRIYRDDVNMIKVIEKYTVEKRMP